MQSVINMPAVLIANIMGLTILFVIAVGNYWRVKEVSKKNLCIFIMFCVSAVSCIVDPICSLADGKPGAVNYFLVLIGNTWLYIGNIVIANVWIELVANHLGAKISHFHRIIIAVLSMVELVLLIANLFFPIVFWVDGNNKYSRTNIYWLFIAFYVVFIAYGLLIYLHERKKSGKLRLFPVWAFIIPTVIGMLIQALNYGVSTTIPFLTVSIACIMICFQNEFLFRDKLTGLYNRFYLNTLEKGLKDSGCEYTIVMADINGFKDINDTYGHRVGDEALICVAAALKDIVNVAGEVIRYAGDEFILILNTQDEDSIQKYINQIHQTMADIAPNEDIPHGLSMSLGYCQLSIKDNPLDDCIDRVDRLMYDNKRKYYMSHPEQERLKKKDC